MKKTLAVVGMLGVFAAAPVFANDMADGSTNTTTKSWNGSSHASMMIKRMDTNGDGVVSADEHAAFAEKMFKEADTNNDGQLSKDEIAAYHQKQRASWNTGKTHHGIGHRGSASDTNNSNNTDANPHPSKDRQDQDY